MLRYSTIRGGFGVPIVAFDGTTEGVSRDGRTLVLAEFGASRQQTRFAVLSTSRLRLQKTVTLRGLWAFDALSRDGRTLYATQYLSAEAERALQRPCGQPRHRQAARRRDRRQARAGRGDERLALVARPQRERRLGVHVLREAERDRVRPRARHVQPARVLRRPAVAVEHAGPVRRAPVARGRRPLARAVEGRDRDGLRSSTRGRSR